MMPSRIGRAGVGPVADRGSRRQASRATWPLPAALLTLVGTLAGALPQAAQAASPTPQAASAPVVVETVSAGAFPVTLDSVGHVEALKSVLIRTQVAGRLLSVGFREGEPVRTGQILATVDPRLLQATVAQDQATIVQDGAALTNAQAVLVRSTPLLTKGLVSAQDLQTQQAQVAEQRARLAADRAVLDRDQIQLGYCSITSPMDGIAGLLVQSPGNIVTPQDPGGLLVITAVEPILALFSIPGASLPDLQRAIRAAGAPGLAVEIWSQSGSERLDAGRLSAVNNQIDATSGTVVLKALVPNRMHLLWPGQFVNVKLVLHVQDQALSVPLDAVEQGPGGSFVWSLAADGRAQRTAVEVGQSSGARVLIASGLKAGDRVVTDGQYGLVPGARTGVVPKGGTPANGQPMRKLDDDQLGIVP